MNYYGEDYDDDYNPTYEELMEDEQFKSTLKYDELKHVGVARRSGRYKYGSGKDPYQHSGDFLSRVDFLRKSNYVHTDENGKMYTGELAIAKSFGLSSTEYRIQKTVATHERRAVEVDQALALREKGYSLNAIAEKMGYKNDSSIRSILNKDTARRAAVAENTANMLRKQVDEKGIVEIGLGVEREIGVKKQKFDEAVYMLEMEGYEKYKGRVQQATNANQFTTMTCLCKPGTEHKEIFDLDNVKSLTDYESQDGGDTFKTFKSPKSFDSKRLEIRYAEDGGTERDGVVELRRGVDDISLGNSSYAQVRVLVDGKRYIKGMAVYSDDLPDGVDMRFNTNKSNKIPKLEVLKEIKDDPDNPFGSYIKANGQREYIDKDGKKQLSVINKRSDEGDWSAWSDKVPSQFLSKQNQTLIDSQLKKTYIDKKAEYDDICALNNPTVKKKLLQSFADDCDSSAVDLKTMSFPGQKYQVILPVPSLKDDKVYAPNYENGTKVALVRYPHGGTFEIPILTVDNKHKDARKVMGLNAKDAIGINAKVADRLSGADFDGDTVAVIPISSKINITSTPKLKGLEGFDPKLEYGPPPNTEEKDIPYKLIKTKKFEGTQMGGVSNLITDMTLKGADTDELARAVRHSMVVIDAKKHKLDYRKSERDNRIKELKDRYQGRYDEDGKYRTGASTLISRAKSDAMITKTRGSAKYNVKGKPWYDPSKPQGAKMYEETKDEYVNAKGELVKPKTRVALMSTVDDARVLSSGTKQENAYASYANSLKALANDARKEYMSTGNMVKSKEAAKKYEKEVRSLEEKLNEAELNRPRERKANIIANSATKKEVAALSDKPTKSELSKINQKNIVAARIKVGSKRVSIDINDNEWEAIQKGAISENKLKKILERADLDNVRERATPKTSKQITPSKVNKMNIMKNSGLYTNSQIAKAIGVSPSTVSNYTLE